MFIHVIQNDNNYNTLDIKKMPKSKVYNIIEIGGCNNRPKWDLYYVPIHFKERDSMVCNILLPHEDY